jgi:hypothetical protein
MGNVPGWLHSRVDEKATGPQDALDLAHEALDLEGRQGHAEQHVGVTGVEAGVGERKGLPNVGDDRLDPPRDVIELGLLHDLGESRLGEVEGRHVDPRSGEPARIPALPRTQLEHLADVFGQEQLECRPAGLAGLGAEEVWPDREGPGPLAALIVGGVRHANRSYGHPVGHPRLPARRCGRPGTAAAGRTQRQDGHGRGVSCLAERRVQAGEVRSTQWHPHRGPGKVTHAS